MFSFNKLSQIQIEITNRCQASCPMCLRNIHGGIENPLLKLNDWTLDQFKTIFNKEVLAQNKHINFCGDFGDPIINNDLIDMCRYVKDNSVASISISTNGSARSVNWWTQLASALPAEHNIEFALDGLADTHHLHRIGTSYDAIIRNASAFIKAGGNASWMFIKFKHNEHQLDDARQLSSDLGFTSFNFKTSKRFGKPFPVLDKKGNTAYYIEQHSNSDINPVEFNDLKDYKKWEVDVSCFAHESKELFIDAHGHLMPCCLIASFLYANYDTKLHSKYNLLDKTLGDFYKLKVYNLINEFGGLDSLNANIHGIKHIMDQPVWQTLIHKKWNEHSSSPCKILCGKSSPYIMIVHSQSFLINYINYVM